MQPACRQLGRSWDHWLGGLGVSELRHPNVCAALAGSRPVLNLGAAFGIEFAYIICLLIVDVKTL